MISGAEAVIEKSQNGVLKKRLVKSYRHPDLDQQLRQFRTRREAKVLSKLPVPGPKLISVDDKEMVIEMEFLDGLQLRDCLSKSNAVQFAKQVGLLIKKLHEASIIHGDLTTSNMIVKEDVLHLIDFGLSQFSDSDEDKAVDLHLLMHSLKAKHPDLDMWNIVLKSYNPSKELKERFDVVESRGKNKK